MTLKLNFFKPGAVCSLFSLLVYVNTFQADFVFDDNRAIVRNPDVLLQTSLFNLLVSDFWGSPLNHSGSHGSYRPLTVLSFRLNYYFFGLCPYGYHVINVMLYCFTTYLFCCVLAKILQFTQNKIYAAGFLFAVHPIHTEAVASIVGRADVLATFFCFTTLLSYKKACDYLAIKEKKLDDRTDTKLSCTNETVQTLSHRKGYKTNKKKTRKRRTKKPEKQSKKCLKSDFFQSSLAGNHSLQYKDVSFDGGTFSDESDSATDFFDSLISHESFGSSQKKLIKEEINGLKQSNEAKFIKTIECNHIGPCLRSSCSETLTEFAKNQLNKNNKISFFSHLYEMIIDHTSRKLNLNGYVWLMFAFLNGICSILSKETGYCAIPLCFVYEIFILDNLSRNGSLKLFFRERPFYFISKRILVGFSLWIAILSIRIGLPLVLSTGEISFPKFSPSDNPVAASDNFLTRVLSFNYLLSCNLQMIFFPISLSFDWSMEAIPLVTSLKDCRNLATCITYALFLKILHYIFLGFKVSFYNENSSRKCANRSFTNFSNAYSEVRRLSSSSDESLINWPSAKSKNNIGKNDDGKTTMYRMWKSNQGVCDFAVFETTSPTSVSLHLRLFFSLCIIIFGLLPASNLLFYVGFVLAERILFLPSVGSCILLVEAGEILMKIAFKNKYFRQNTSVIFQQKFKSKGVANKSHLVRSLFCVIFYGWLVILIFYFAAKTVHRNQDWKNEISLYRSGVSSNPAKAFANLGNALKTQGRVVEAENAYKEALKSRPNMADVHYNLGLLYQETGRHEMAEKCYRQAIRYRPAMALAYLNLGVVLSQQNRLDEAKTVYRRAGTLENPETKDPRTHSYAQLSALYNLGCLLADAGDHQSAVVVFQEALSRPLNHYKLHSLYNMLGQSMFHLNRPDEAETWYKASLSSKPDHVPAHLAYAQLLASRGEVELALSLYEQAMELEPENKVVYSHYSSFLIKTNRLNKAAEVLALAVEAPFGRDDYDLISSAASTLRKIKKYDQAEKYYIKAAKLAPNISISFLNLGAVQHLQKKYKLAEKSYLKALKIDPKNELTLQNLTKLKRIVKETSTIVS